MYQSDHCLNFFGVAESVDEVVATFGHQIDGAVHHKDGIMLVFQDGSALLADGKTVASYAPDDAEAWAYQRADEAAFYSRSEKVNGQAS